MSDEFSESCTPCMSSDIRVISAALLKAKKNFISLAKQGYNAHLRYKYARIGDIYNAIESALSEEGILIIHFGYIDDGSHRDGSHQDEAHEVLFTRLVHVMTGQFFEDKRILQSDKVGNQSRGAANTYMRKLAVISLCSISDDDGDDDDRDSSNQDSSNQDSSNQDSSNRDSEGAVINFQQIKELEVIIKSAANGAKLYNDILLFNKIKQLKELKSSQFLLVRNYLFKNK